MPCDAVRCDAVRRDAMRCLDQAMAALDLKPQVRRRKCCRWHRYRRDRNFRWHSAEQTRQLSRTRHWNRCSCVSMAPNTAMRAYDIMTEKHSLSTCSDCRGRGNASKTRAPRYRAPGRPVSVSAVEIQVASHRFCNEVGGCAEWPMATVDAR